MINALGLDLGNKRIGIAGCDGLGLIATGITTIEHRSLYSTITYLQDIVTDRQVNILIVGLPYTMTGELGSQAQKIQKLAQKIATALNLPLEYVDERLTSVEAEELIKTHNKKNSYNKGLIDMIAAQIILQTWLDQRK